MRRALIAQLIVLGVFLSAIGIAIGLAIDWFPAQAATQADDVDNLFDILLIVSIPIFVLVEMVVIVFVWKFRMRPGQENEDGPPIHGNTRLEVIWTAIPALLLFGLCAYAWIVLDDMEAKQPNTMTVNVVGEQFAWTFEYPGKTAGGKPVVSPQLYLPCTPTGRGNACKGVPVRFKVRSKDVIHDFWVPEFRMKIDAVPGITTSYRVTPSRLGSYPVVCAELCGLGHATMRQTAHVVRPAVFEAWLRRQGGAGEAGGAARNAGGGGDLVAQGRQIFAQAAQPACSSCHTLADAGSSAATGPDLDQVLKGKDAAFVERAIVDPNAEVAAGYPQNVMPPNYGSTLSKPELKALVAYLVATAGKK